RQAKQTETVVQPPPRVPTLSDVVPTQKPKQPERKEADHTRVTPGPATGPKQQPAEDTQVRAQPREAAPQKPQRATATTARIDHGPGALQLLLIAAGSFVLVFAAGAMLVRYGVF